MLTLDGVQNLLPAAAEEFYVGGQRALDFRDQRQALREPFPRACDFKAHQLAKGGGVFAVRGWLLR